MIPCPQPCLTSPSPPAHELLIAPNHHLPTAIYNLASLPEHLPEEIGAPMEENAAPLLSLSPSDLLPAAIYNLASLPEHLPEEVEAPMEEGRADFTALRVLLLMLRSGDLTEVSARREYSGPS